MAENVTSLAIYLQPGMSVEIKVPVRQNLDTGFFAMQGSEPPRGYFEGKNDVGDMKRGFVCENTKVGDIVPSAEVAASVVYTHKVGVENSVWFFAATGEVGVVNIISVPIHDHSSIIQGGPAYGTYFDDDEEA